MKAKLYTPRGRLIKSVLAMEKGDIIYTTFSPNVITSYRIRNVVCKVIWAFKTYGNSTPEVFRITEIAAIDKPYDERKVKSSHGRIIGSNGEPTGECGAANH